MLEIKETTKHEAEVKETVWRMARDITFEIAHDEGLKDFVVTICYESIGEDATSAENYLTQFIIDSDIKVGGQVGEHYDIWEDFSSALYDSICRIFPKANKKEAGALSDKIYAVVEKLANDSEIVTK